jgi:hypothetical protein
MDGDVTLREIDAFTVAEMFGDKLLPAGEVQFGVGRKPRELLDAIGTRKPQISSPFFLCAAKGKLRSYFCVFGFSRPAARRRHGLRSSGTARSSVRSMKAWALPR